jgi:hypothetical protein
MPLFLYLPMIIWTGMVQAAQEPKPVKVKARK